MAFDKEPSGYKKTVLSDLQGAWQNLRDTVVSMRDFPAGSVHCCTSTKG
jgi:hypothetical protein